MRSRAWVVMLFGASGLAACGAESFVKNETTTPSQQSLMATCAAAWDASKVYVGGDTASLNGVNYTANYWNQGTNPAQNSGAQGSGQPWTANGSCDSNGGSTTDPNASNPNNGSGTGSGGSTSDCYPAWDSSKVYVGGDHASVDGVNYTASYWNQGQNPAQNSGPAGSGQPWVNAGSCDGTGGGTTDPNSGTGGTTDPNSGTGGTTDPNSGTGGGNTPDPNSATAPGFVFSPYKDVTISANWNTSVISTAVAGTLSPVTEAVPNVPVITWAFATGECGSENWGGISADTLASANVQSWVKAGKKYVLSTGGAAGSFTCGSDAGFSAFLERYWSDNLLGVDFDIEAGQNQAVVDALIARVKTAQSNPRYAKLRFSFTIATLGGNNAQNLGSMGILVMNSIKSAGLQNYYVNLMTMDYGAPTASVCTVANGACDMAASAITAAESLHNYYGVPYAQIELTPMIGGNDTQGETFSLENVVTVSNYVKQKSLGGLHFWSLDRDKDCAPGYASPICNSYGQAGTLGFSNKFLNSL